MRFLLPLLLAPWLGLSDSAVDPKLQGDLPTQHAETAKPMAPGPFEEIPGARKLSSRLIVRPLQKETLLERGRSARDFKRTTLAARRVLARLDCIEYIPQTDETILGIPEGSSEQIVSEALMATGLFQYAEPDWVVFPGEPFAATQGSAQSAGTASKATPTLTPNCSDDPRLATQWHHSPQVLQSCAAWNLETGTPLISIGVCDTGIRTSHEDLQLHRLEGYNAVDRLWESQGGNIYPAHYHGTRTTGVVAGNGNNGVGISGVGWNLSHRMLRVSNLSDGSANLSNLQHAARIAVEHGDRIANVSYHGAYFASNKTTATYIKSIGGLMIWGAGNTSTNFSNSDRDADDVIVVSATDINDNLWSFSSYGTYIDLAAPGANIHTSDSGHNSDYATASGTSYSSPMVAGVCAMIWSQRPNLSPNDVEAILKASCQDIGAPGLDAQFGHGRIDLLAALELDGIAQPIAKFAAPLRSGRSPLTVDFRDLSTGVPTSWSWDFGDGSTSSEQNPIHTYTSLGYYSVSLTTSNALGTDTSTLLDYVLVDVIPPVASISAMPTAGLAPLPVQFTDDSTGGVPTSWTWDFGDGSSSTEQNPLHTYTNPGFYTVTLTASNVYGSDVASITDLIAVDLIPPVAEFTATPTSGNSPIVVQFTDESGAGTATSWAWNFGDGRSSSLQHPSHTYTAAGTYTVTLTSSNAYGSDQRVRTSYISVGAGPPLLAQFSGTPITGPAPLQVDFTDLSIGAVTDWTWEFDDGTESALQHPTHTFATPGEYNIALEISNASGDSHSIEIEAYIVVQ
ncbi:MAG: PKD domain-containing protein [bacterium]|nr:PKD domain-containing protein [bacterium]